MDTENGKIIATRAKRLKAGVIFGGILLVLVCPLIVCLALYSDQKSDVAIYSAVTVALFFVLIWRIVELCTLPKIYILFKDGRFYLYPDKKTVIELYPHEITKVTCKHYSGGKYRHYASTSGKLYVMHSKGATTFRFVEYVDLVCSDMGKIIGEAEGGKPFAPENGEDRQD